MPSSPHILEAYALSFRRRHAIAEAVEKMRRARAATDNLQHLRPTRVVHLIAPLAPVVPKRLSLLWLAAVALAIAIGGIWTLGHRTLLASSADEWRDSHLAR